MIVRKGNLAPGTTGSFASFKDPLLNQDGDLAFIGKIAGTGVNTSNDFGLFTTLSGSLTLVMREGDVLANPNGAIVKSISSVALDEEQVAVVAALVTGTNDQPGPGGVTKTNDVALFLCDGSSVALVLREGDVVPLTTGSMRITKLTALAPGNAAPAFGHGLERGQTLVRISGTAGAQAVLAVTGTGMSEIAAAGGPAPGYDIGATFKSFGVPVQDALGAAAFQATAKTGTAGVTTANSAGIYAEIDGELRSIVKTGTVAPILGGTFSSFKDPVRNGVGAVAFLTGLKGTGISGSNDTVIYWAGPLGLGPVAREGMPAPETTGTAGAALFKSFSSLTVAEPPFGPVFLAKLQTGAAGAAGPGGAVSSNDVGLWALDQFGAVRLLIREGGPFAGKTVKSFVILSAASGSATQTRSINAKGELAAKVQFTDSSQAIVKIQIP